MMSDKNDSPKATDDEIETLNQGVIDADKLTPEELEQASGGGTAVAGGTPGSVLDPLIAGLGSCNCDGSYCRDFSSEEV
jgi:hypothetical protein